MKNHDSEYIKDYEMYSVKILLYYNCLITDLMNSVCKEMSALKRAGSKIVNIAHEKRSNLSM